MLGRYFQKTTIDTSNRTEILSVLNKRALHVLSSFQHSRMHSLFGRSENRLSLHALSLSNPGSKRKKSESNSHRSIVHLFSFCAKSKRFTTRAYGDWCFGFSNFNTNGQNQAAVNHTMRSFKIHYGYSERS